MDWQSLYPEILGDSRLSKGDVARMRGLQRTADAHKWCKQKISELKRRMVALRTVRDLTAPFRHLPSELLMLTFAHLCPATRADAFSILRVCRRWNQVLLRTPSFWANLIEDAHPRGDYWRLPPLSDDHRGLAVMRFALAHSGVRPLRLSIRGIGEVAEALLPHAPKLSYLDVQIMTSADSDTFNAIVLPGMPRLEHLSIAWDDIWEDPVPVGFHLRSQDFSLLHTLQIAAVHFSVDEPPLSLRHLILEDCSCARCVESTSMQMCGFFNALERCSRLETLHFQTSEMDRTLEGVPSNRLVSLPLLHKLTLAGFPHQIFSLLTHLDLPNASVLDFTLAADLSYSPGTNFVNAIPKTFVTLFSALSSAERVHLMDDRNDECWRVATYVGDWRRVHITIEYSSLNTIDHTNVTSLVNHFAPYLSSVPHLEFLWRGRIPQKTETRVARSRSYTGYQTPVLYEQSDCEALCGTLAPALEKRTGPTPLKSLVIYIFDPDDYRATWRADEVQEWLSAGLGHLAQHISVRYFDGTIDYCCNFRPELGVSKNRVD
ncbi:hypothetical protein C8Q74DRAFT_377419 [Fomes fomentarius]|nr:hypothetical protein C8Q74DRAFT_377419 [Fomes fomentarius]